MWEYAAAWKHPLPLPSSIHLPQKHQTSLKGMAAWSCSGEHEFFSKKILPNPDSSIYFLPHGRRKAPVIQSGCSSGVERNLAKVDVVGSNPIIRSIFYPRPAHQEQAFLLPGQLSHGRPALHGIEPAIGRTSAEASSGIPPERKKADNPPAAGEPFRAFCPYAPALLIKKAPA